MLILSNSSHRPEKITLFCGITCGMNRLSAAANPTDRLEKYMQKIKHIVLLLVLSIVLSACLHDENNDTLPPPPMVEAGSISGTITTASTSAIDSDVNGLLTFGITRSNSSIDEAQSLQNPVLLGGYLNLPGQGPTSILENGEIINGLSHENGDLLDVYKVDLTEGQTITLTIAEVRASNDLRLMLIKSSLIDNTIEIINTAMPNAASQTDQMVVTRGDITGDYFVAVAICNPNNPAAVNDCGALAANYRGYTNYSLRIAQPATQAATRANVDLNSDFLPGEIVVKFKQPLLSASVSMTQALSSVAQNLGLQVKTGAMGQISLLSLGKTAAQQKGAMTALGFAGVGAKVAAGRSGASRQLKLDTLLAIQALRQNPQVEYAEPNFIRRAFLIPKDEYYENQWHYPLINLPQAWDISTGAISAAQQQATGQSQVIVAVLDSGLLLQHPDIQGQTVPGYDFVSDVSNAGDGDGIDADPTDPSDPSSVGSSSFHGTHVAGIIAAKTTIGGVANSGVAGIAWQAKIMPVRVLGATFGTSFDVMRGLLFAAGLMDTIDSDSPPRPTQKADIINLSLGGKDSSSFEQQIMTAIRAEGVIIVAAAGNDSTLLSPQDPNFNVNEPQTAPMYPASYKGVISVSAVSSSLALAPYSSFGNKIDIAAPGGDQSEGVSGGVLSSVGDDSIDPMVFTYKYSQGTSMAAPHVAGVLALMKAVNPALLPIDIDRKLANGDLTDDLGATVKDNEFGYGLINALKAVIAAGSTPVNPILSATPRVLNFGATISQMTFNLANVGSDSIMVQTLTSDQSLGLSVTPGTDVATDGLGEYIVTVDRGSSVVFGSHTGKITVTTDANTVDILVTMQKINPDAVTNASAGNIYLLVVDPTITKGSPIVATAFPTLTDGSYSYGLNVPVGEYHLFAGNDSDNDLLICGKSESCGAYSSRALPSLVTVTANEVLSNINFTVNFDEGLLLQSTASSDPENASRAIPRALFFNNGSRSINLNILRK